MPPYSAPISIFIHNHINLHFCIVRTGQFATPIDVHSAVHDGEEALQYDSHNSSAIGVGPNGVIFVTGKHHASELNMAKSTTPYDISSFARMLPADMIAASDVNRVTYPLFFTHGRFLYFSYREIPVRRLEEQYSGKC